MTENELVATVVSVLAAGFSARSISVGIQQAYQPTQQGAPSAPCVLFHKVGDNEYGFPERTNKYDAENNVMVHTETQIMEITFQIEATATQDPTNTTQLTAGDYVKYAARILGSDATVVALAALSIGIYRIQKIGNTFLKNDFGRFEASPTFDFTLTYPQTETTQIPSTEVVIGNIFVIT